MSPKPIYMTKREPFPGVLFDMDGLLLDTERLIVEASERTADVLGLGDLGPTHRAMIGLRIDRAIPILERALAGRVTLDTFRSEFDKHVVTLERDGVPVRPGVLELLEQLAARDLACAVATSTNRETTCRRLGDANLLRYFETITCGEDVDAPKPHPEIYLKAAASLGLDARNCCAFEDSGPGTQAAVASGATVVQVPDLVPPSDQLRALGHIIADNVLDGAKLIGLLD